jgi:hypothetical protein
MLTELASSTDNPTPMTLIKQSQSTAGLPDTDSPQLNSTQLNHTRIGKIIVHTLCIATDSSQFTTTKNNIKIIGSRQQ